MGQGDLRLYPFQAVLRQIKLPKEGGRERKRLNRGTDVMNKTGKGQRCGTHAAADGLCGLQKQDSFESAAKGDRRRQTVRPGTHNHGIVIISLWHQSFTFRLWSFFTTKHFFSR